MYTHKQWTSIFAIWHKSCVGWKTTNDHPRIEVPMFKVDIVLHQTVRVVWTFAEAVLMAGNISTYDKALNVFQSCVQQVCLLFQLKHNEIDGLHISKCIHWFKTA